MAAVHGGREKDKGVNVQVLVRCRPSNEEESKQSAFQAVVCNEARKEVAVHQSIAGKQIDRTFTFDKVFGPESKQCELYEQAVVPIVHEVLEGFNCTIFAYGQTGTGKTYTMEGNAKKGKDSTLPEGAGVIPRAVQQIFDTLESQSAEYSVKTTFLELYNEEITDLLATDVDMIKGSSADGGSRKPLALMEDGRGGVIVRGLEEEIVKNAGEIYSLLDRGSAKRRTAETLLNKQSSRSHSVFAITIHIKESTPEGEELIKCGKLNLVDLAGSENISRSGASRADGRAQEAGLINKSLLTLGRVITALVEHLGHIPYRDSKLTRLLRDSLGGRTKTCIIATVSPNAHCLEETLSTLDYAQRAKNIKNKPEVNQKMTKTALIKDMAHEIDRLKQELGAAREKNGIYVPRDRYFEDEAYKKELAERVEVLETEAEAKEKVLEETTETCEQQKKQLEDLTLRHTATQGQLEQTQAALLDTQAALQKAEGAVQERDFVIACQKRAEEALVKKADSLRAELHATSQDVTGLFAKIERKSSVEVSNKRTGATAHARVAGQLSALESAIHSAVAAQQAQLAHLATGLAALTDRKERDLPALSAATADLRDLFERETGRALEQVRQHVDAGAQRRGEAEQEDEEAAAAAQAGLGRAVQEAGETLKALQGALDTQHKQVTAMVQQQREATSAALGSCQAMSASMQSALGTLQQAARDCGLLAAETHRGNTQVLATLVQDYKAQAAAEEAALVERVSALVGATLGRQAALLATRVEALEGGLVAGEAGVQAALATMGEHGHAAIDAARTWEQHAEKTAHATLQALTQGGQAMEETAQESASLRVASAHHWTALQATIAQHEKEQQDRQAAERRTAGEADTALLSTVEGWTTTAAKAADDVHQRITTAVTGAHSEEVRSLGALSAVVTNCGTAAARDEEHHSRDVTDVQAALDQFFDHDLLDDISTARTPKRRHIEVPPQATIESLRAPDFSSLVEDFRGKQAQNSNPLLQDGTVKPESRIPCPPTSKSQEGLDRSDSRIPFAALCNN
ncbi:Kinesin-like protein [Klebsormidium nitens]|uniref:Kinesin-like protein n=1 Tax=Klebsormidium nitens TaxID=105231 RepID=A0A1Y1IH75_KLENI|nr:Kinesin-like protein [Klebsormidium nitens]|eukprot:GAQ87488.1 Kinesin-like protein [Klebsormidium nitens]